MRIIVSVGRTDTLFATPLGVPGDWRRPRTCYARCDLLIILDEPPKPHFSSEFTCASGTLPGGRM